MAVLALRAIHEMEPMVEENESRELVDACPRHRLFGRSKRTEFLDCRFVLRDQDVTCQALTYGRKTHLRPKLRRRRMAILTREFRRDGMGLMAERNRLRDRQQQQQRGDHRLAG